MNRAEFRQAVFDRDQNKCVICGEPATDAHHIMERKLFPNGGYDPDNGASLCEQHHWQAETTVLSASEIRRAAIVRRVVLPPNFGPGNYDKWGNPILSSGLRLRGPIWSNDNVQLALAAGGMLNLFTDQVKYPRTPHMPLSPGKGGDDLLLADLGHFRDKQVVLTKKMDGENTTMTRQSIYARSLDSRHHGSRSWVKGLWAKIRNDIPEGWRICGENVYAIHSIPYEDLASYFLVFAIYDNFNQAATWFDLCTYCSLMDLAPVPEVSRPFWFDEAEVYRQAQAVVAQGDEGVVLRLLGGYHFVSHFWSTAKYVRPGHVTTGEHWMHGPVAANKLIEP